ncbi:MAG: HYR domain-containing protein, partial [Bacteroidales bacterium]|nr:HYR domain-containing protein [Bacteroidales bacterium]
MKETEADIECRFGSLKQSHGRTSVLLKLFTGILFWVLGLGVMGQEISVPVVNGSVFCQGSSITIDFNTNGTTFNVGNIFTVELSDENGDFTASVDIGLQAAFTGNVSVTGTIPTGLPGGTGYRVRVRSSDPSYVSGVSNDFEIIIDNQPPTITCPANINNVTADANQCYATGVALGTPTTADNCGVDNVSNNAPAQFPVGTTTVTWTVTDIHGNTATCNQTVTVVDNQIPTITCPANINNVTADANQCYATGVALGTPTTADNCGVDNVSNNAPAQFPVGTTTVTWTVTDIHGNTATCNQTVTVVDNQ